jgi:hypothetical protein
MPVQAGSIVGSFVLCCLECAEQLCPGSSALGSSNRHDLYPAYPAERDRLCGQTMTLHRHLHCIVPGGGLTKQGKWKGAKSKGKFLFPVKAMSKVFRGRYIDALKEALPEQMTQELISALYKHQWVVYAKRPFNGPSSVVVYLGRYTHKIAISNHRIKNVEAGRVTFSYKDYRHGSVTKEMTLEATEFIRRFALHVLPRGFVRIRHYGICSSTSKLKCAEVIKTQVKAPVHKLVHKDTARIYHPGQCPCCKKQSMETILRFHRRGPPQGWKALAQDILAHVTKN